MISKNLMIGVVIFCVCLVIGKYAIQDYYYSKLLGEWGGKFQIDFFGDNRWTAQNLKLIFNEDKTMRYEINLSANGQNINFFSNVFSVNKASRKMKRYFDGHFHYEWPFIHIELSPRSLPINIIEAYPPFIVDSATVDPQTGKPVIKLSAKVDFKDDNLILQGTVIDPVQFSRDGTAYNAFTIQEDDEYQSQPGSHRVVKRIMKSN